jgi:hypothetical protein
MIKVKSYSDTTKKLDASCTLITRKHGRGLLVMTLHVGMGGQAGQWASLWFGVGCCIRVSRQSMKSGLVRYG